MSHSPLYVIAALGLGAAFTLGGGTRTTTPPATPTSTPFPPPAAFIAVGERCRHTTQCACQGQEMYRRTPPATLAPILAQPKSEAQRAALIQALIATYVRDHLAIDRVCGPPLHPETAAPA